MFSYYLWTSYLKCIIYNKCGCVCVLQTRSVSENQNLKTVTNILYSVRIPIFLCIFATVNFFVNKNHRHMQTGKYPP